LCEVLLTLANDDNYDVEQDDIELSKYHPSTCGKLLRDIVESAAPSTMLIWRTVRRTDRPTDKPNAFVASSLRKVS